MKVSIITVVFNGEKYIEECLSSVNEQVGDYEHIVVDGGSTDRTIEIVNSFRSNRIILISETDDGIYFAMNKGISAANGDVISFLNSDDFLEKDTIKWVAEQFGSDPQLDVLCGSVRVIVGEEWLTPMFATKMSLVSEMLPHPSVFIRKSRIGSNLRYSTNFVVASDYELLLRLRHLGYNFHSFDKILATYRKGGFSSTLKRQIQSIYETTQIQDLYGLLSIPLSMKLSMRFTKHFFFKIDSHKDRLDFLYELREFFRQRKSSA